MSDYLHYAKTGGKVVADVVGGFGAVVGFADATGYYYASSYLNGILQAQFQDSGWPKGTSKVANTGDVKGAIMFARDQYYSKAKSSLGGAFFDLAKGFITDGVLGVISGGWWYGVKGLSVAYDMYEGKGKVQGAYKEINAFKDVPKVPDGPAKMAATVLVNFSYGQTKFKAKGKNRAASDALGYILGTEVTAYRAQQHAYKTRDGAIDRVAAWLSI